MLSTVMGAGCALASWDGFSPGDTKSVIEPREGADAADASVTDAPSKTDTGPEPPPIAFVQVNATSTDSVQVKTVTVRFAKAQAAGNLNVVAIGWYDTNVALLGVKDSQNNTYQRAVGPTIVGTTSPVAHAIYFAPNIAAAAADTNTVTVEWMTNADSPDVRVLEYSGLDKTSPLDTVAEGKGTGLAAATAATPMTMVGRALLFSAGTSQGDYGTAGAGFNVRIITAQTSIAQDRIVDMRGTFTATAPVTDPTTTTPEWVLQLAIFH
jgi:hypothetical protein